MNLKNIFPALDAFWLERDKELHMTSRPTPSPFHAATERFVGELRLYMRRTDGTLAPETQDLHEKLIVLEGILDGFLMQMRKSLEAQRDR